MKTILLIALLCACSIAFAQTNVFITFTNKSGVVISNAEVVKFDASKLTYRIPTGGGTVKLADLPPELQNEFGYSEQDAKALDAKEQQVHAADLKQRAIAATALEKYNRLKAQLVQGSRRINGKVLQKILDGLLVQSGEHAKALQAYHEDVYGARGGTITEGTGPGVEALSLVLLQDYPDANMADEGHVDVIAYPVGLFGYDSVGKSRKTVRKFSCDLEAAIRALALEQQN